VVVALVKTALADKHRAWSEELPRTITTLS
jgi:hypothetical protein